MYCVLPKRSASAGVSVSTFLFSSAPAPLHPLRSKAPPLTQARATWRQTCTRVRPHGGSPFSATRRGKRAWSGGLPFGRRGRHPPRGPYPPLFFPAPRRLGTLNLLQVGN